LKTAYFGLPGRFESATFKGNALLNKAKFDMGALFSEAQFHEAAQFCDVQFDGPNLFDAAQFEGGGPEFSALMVSKPDREQRWPVPWQIEVSANGDSPPRLVRRQGESGPVA